MDNMENIENMEQMENVNGQKNALQPECRTHRVGTVTCGLVLVLYGVLFLIRIAVPGLKYEIIFDLWPVTLIMLGVEILLSSTGKNQEKQKFIYDFPAVLIIVIMLFFAMIMAVIDAGMRHGGIWY